MTAPDREPLSAESREWLDAALKSYREERGRGVPSILMALAIGIERSAYARGKAQGMEEAAGIAEGYTYPDAYDERVSHEKRLKIEEGMTFGGMDELREDIQTEGYGAGIKYLIQFGRGIAHDAMIRTAAHLAAAIREAGHAKG